MSRSKLSDLLILILLEVVANTTGLAFELSFLPSTVLFLVLPAGYLAFRLRRRSQWPRILAMGFLFGIWYGYLFAYLADFNRIWAWPEASLPWGWTFGVNPVEWLWVFIWILFIVLFYEHFMERDTRSAVSSNILYAVTPAVIISVLIYAFIYLSPEALSWTHAYAVLAVLASLPVLILLKRNPRIFPKLFLPGLFFIPLHFAYEATALALGQWYFPATYFALVPLPGGTGVPIEEFILWIVLGSTIVISYYELYVDDGK